MAENHIGKMDDPLWTPGAERVARSNLRRFEAFLRERFGQSFPDYGALHRWSVDAPAEFWQAVWEFTGVRASRAPEAVLVDAERFPGARWFDGARLNYAENLLQRRGNGTAIIARLENGRRQQLSWQELHDAVARAAAALRAAGVGPGDCVAGMLPNVAETVIAMLAAASIGALWSSCSPDFGVSGVLDRFGQIAPKVLFACDGYFYGGKAIDCRDKVAAVCAGLDGAPICVVVPVLGDGGGVDGAHVWSTWIGEGRPVPILEFKQLPFDHPLFVMYSSGTTGVPKCIVHGAGGTLLQHLKEHQLHAGLRRDDVFFYFTTCGWMMWNWLVSGLASGATLLLYDGSPFHPGPEAIFDIADAEGIAILGVGAKYIAGIEKAGLRPSQSHHLAGLRTILSTGSPLSDGSFRYVYRHVKRDVCLSSISGGTDIISCFAVGNECLPVRAGELQCLGLGMAVEIWDDDARPLVGRRGELVCTRPFPSAPLGFWDDPDGMRYEAAYFERFPGIWAHGDYGEITEHGGVVIHGRSDSVLNPGGVRIGTAEIYRQVETVTAVQDSVCVGQEWQGDVRVVLFVVLGDGHALTSELEAEIRAAIRGGTTPRHVPAKIVAVTDIPRTRSGKIAEIAVRKIINGDTVANTEALANPEALAQYARRPELAG